MDRHHARMALSLYADGHTHIFQYRRRYSTDMVRCRAFNLDCGNHCNHLLFETLEHWSWTKNLRIDSRNIPVDCGDSDDRRTEIAGFWRTMIGMPNQRLHRILHPQRAQKPVRRNVRKIKE